MTRTPMHLIAGSLGSGKTTLLQRLLSGDHGRLAVLVNEFGELGIDGELIAGTDVDMVELTGGCVCCSLAGEFEAAVREIIERVGPEAIVVETTGVAEADALVLDVEDTLPEIRIETVVMLVDAEAALRFPEFGRTERTQIETADLILLNKTDLVSEVGRARVRERLSTINPHARLIETIHADIDPALMFGRQLRLDRRPRPGRATDTRDHGMTSFSWHSGGCLDRACFEAAVEHWPQSIYRAKGRLRLRDGDYYFNYVAGRWALDPAGSGESRLVWIGPGIDSHRDTIIGQLEACLENPAQNAGYEFLDEIAIADIALRAWGGTLSDVFRQTARATAEVMVDDLDTIAPHERREVRLSGDDVEMLLFDFLQELIFYKDAEGLILLPEQVDVSESDGGHQLQATLVGEVIDPTRHPTSADVKAVTMHRFALRRGDDGLWRTDVVLDI